jgi:SAM-dependent methyltransferase
VAPGRAQAPKSYDQAYFDHWYRDRGFGSPVRLERKVRYAVGAAEYLLERPVRTVLDVGCGEGAWRGALRRHRPGVRYLGVDPSEYAVRRYGRTRNLRLGGVGDLEHLELGGPFDLVVCSDVLAYVPDGEARRGLRAVASLLVGVLFLEVFTAGDDFEGDLDGFRARPAGTYRRWFTAAGLHRCGPSLLVPRALGRALPAI